jgi:hypothetical protein
MNELSKSTSPTTPITNDLIIAHMSTIQGLITRFAGNSANCKTMCLTIIAAILALLAANKEPQTLKVAYFVLFLLAWLDAYYLGLERTAVALSRTSAKKIQSQTFAYTDLFHIAIGGRGWAPIWNAFRAMFSHSIWPFYGGILGCIVVIHWYFARIP